MPYKQLMKERLNFLNIDDKTIAEIRQAKDILEPVMDEVLDNLYSHILNEPDLKPLFEDKSVIEKARNAQKQHWVESLFNGEYDNAYYEKTSVIGRAHARIGLTPNWYIGGYNQMLCQFIEKIYRYHADNSDLAISIIQSVSKIIYLDMDLVISCYLDAKDESIRRMLVSSSELRADMWKFSDDMNEVASDINLTAKALSENTLEKASATSSDTELLVQNQDVVYGSIKLLGSQAERLSSHASRLEEHLKSLPLSEKLYLPKGGFFSALKELLFRKKYHNHKA